MRVCFFFFFFFFHCTNRRFADFHLSPFFPLSRNLSIFCSNVHSSSLLFLKIILLLPPPPPHELQSFRKKADNLFIIKRKSFILSFELRFCQDILSPENDCYSPVKLLECETFICVVFPSL